MGKLIKLIVELEDYLIISKKKKKKRKKMNT